MQQIEQEFQQDNKDFIHTAVEFNKVNLATAEDAKLKDDYFDPLPEDVQQIEQEFQQDNKDFIHTTLEFNKVNLATAEDAKQKKSTIF